jgi:hypothetical protein
MSPDAWKLLLFTPFLILFFVMMWQSGRSKSRGERDGAI